VSRGTLIKLEHWSLGGGPRAERKVVPLVADQLEGTTQACLFRDNYSPITAAGLSVYGLSTDSPKSNTTFATKQSLPFPLLCDPSATLTGAIGMKKAAKSTTRGVVVIDKVGKVQVWEQAGPQKTVDAVMAYVQRNGTTSKSAPPPAPASDTTMADVPPASGSTETAPAKTNDAAPTTTTEAGPATANDEPPKMNEVPVIKEASAEEVKAAETAAEVGETAAKIDSAEEVKA
jgi:AhpC/TSA family